jgi:methyl-accepting chemotaxis protein
VFRHWNLRRKIVAVAANITETATAAQEVTRNIAGVDRYARRTAADADLTRPAGDHLAGLAEQIHGLIGQFRVSV